MLQCPKCKANTNNSNAIYKVNEQYIKIVKHSRHAIFREEWKPVAYNHIHFCTQCGTLFHQTTDHPNKALWKLIQFFEKTPIIISGIKNNNEKHKEFHQLLRNAKEANREHWERHKE